jgi:hypothetical protein
LFLALAAMTAACGSEPRPASREYARTLSTVSRIAAEVLLERGFRIVSDVHEAGEAKINAEQPGGRVEVRSRTVEPERTLVTVRLKELPRKTGEDLLNRITERVAAEDLAVPVLALSSAEAVYPRPLAVGVSAAEEAFLRLTLGVTEHEVAEDHARLVSRTPQESSEIRLTAEAPDRFRAVFEAGAETKQQADRLLGQLREEFEYALAETR